MNGVASQHSQSQSLLNASTISGPAGIADPNSGAGSTPISNQQALQHSPHQDSSPPNDTNVPSDNPSSSDPDPLMTIAGEPPGDKDEEGQSQIESVVIKEEGEVSLRTVNGQIEFLEHTPEVSVGSGDAEVMVNEDARDWIPDADHELKRVKVCQLISLCIPPSDFNICSLLTINLLRCTNLLAHGGWIKGQHFASASFKKKQMKPFLSPAQKGIITTSYFPLLFAQTMFISDNKVSRSCRLDCSLQFSSVLWLVIPVPTWILILPHLDTLIVWTEPDGVDYALSFQDPEGCAEVWNFILEVQRHMNNSGLSSLYLF